MAEHMDSILERERAAPLSLLDYFEFGRSVKLDQSVMAHEWGTVRPADRRWKRIDEAETEVDVAIG
jgi:hypothetical protein